jgi:hypothetical protein
VLLGQAPTSLLACCQLLLLLLQRLIHLYQGVFLHNRPCCLVIATPAAAVPAEISQHL